MLLVAMPEAPSSVLAPRSKARSPEPQLLVTASKALVTRSDALVTNSFLLLVAMPLLLVVMSFVTSSDAIQSFQSPGTLCLNVHLQHSHSLGDAEGRKEGRMEGRKEGLKPNYLSLGAPRLETIASKAGGHRS